MTIALPIIFSLIGVVSIAVIWHTVSSNMGVIAELRRHVTMPEYGSEMTINFRSSSAKFDPLSALRRPRQVRVPTPKRITHRLHQFAKERSAA